MNGRSVRRGQELGLARRWAVDLAQATADERRPGVLDDASVVTVEGECRRIGLEAVDSVVEGVREQDAPKLSVGHDVEPDVDLAFHHVPDRRVLELTQAAAVLLTLLTLQGGVPPLVDAMDLGKELRGSQETADVIRPSGRARRLLAAGRSMRTVSSMSAPCVISRVRCCSDPRRTGCA